MGSVQTVTEFAGSKQGRRGVCGVGVWQAARGGSEQQQQHRLGLTWLRLRGDGAGASGLLDVGPVSFCCFVLVFTEVEYCSNFIYIE